MKDREAVEAGGQMRQADFVAAHFHLSRIREAPLICAGQTQNAFDEDLHQRHVLEMQKREPLAERLRLMLALDPEPQPRVQSARAALQAPHCLLAADRARSRQRR